MRMKGTRHREVSFCMRMRILHALRFSGQIQDDGILKFDFVAKRQNGFPNPREEF